MTSLLGRSPLPPPPPPPTTIGPDLSSRYGGDGTLVVPLSMPTSASPSPSRPSLLPQNRRLRHLRRITLHNLALTRPPPRSPPRAADDNVLPSTTARPPNGLQTHLSAPLTPPLPAHPGLQHSRSSENLIRVVARHDVGLEDGELPRDKGKGKAAVPQTAVPQRAGARRWSITLAGQATGPRERQEVLERALDSRLADVFFSLHCIAEAEPVYVSEVVERSMNFSFGVLDLSQHPPAVSRAPHMTVKIWARRPRHDWTLLIQDWIDLRSLTFLGTDPDPAMRLPANALLLHLVDGVYSLDVPLRHPRPTPPPLTRERSQTRNPVEPVPMASYSTLMKLSTFERSIQDVIASRDEVAAQVDAHLRQPPLPTQELPSANDDLERARHYVAQQRRALASAQKRRIALRESLRTRRQAIRAGKNAADQAAVHVAEARENLEASKQLATKTREDIQAQRRRICNDLASVYSITPDADGTAPLAFRICGLPLPNTTYDAAAAKAVNEDVVSAALGLVARLVDQLQCYLAVPVPYPVTSFGSRSMIRDDISLIPESLYASSRQRPNTPTSAVTTTTPSSVSPSPKHRDYPLHLPRGGSTAGQFRFDYAWFLLNKDVEALAAAHGLRVVDIRHTLPNIKTLLYVCGAGSEQAVAERKRGGVIRALLDGARGRPGSVGGGSSVGTGVGVGTGSRPGSADSEVPLMIGGIKSHTARPTTTLATTAAMTTTTTTTAKDLDGATLSSTPSSSPSPLSTSFKLPFSSGGSGGSGGSDHNNHHNNNHQHHHHHHHHHATTTAAVSVPAKMTLRTRGLRENVAASP